MIEYLKSDIGFFISMIVVFVGGIGLGAGITDALLSWKGEDDNDNEDRQS